MKKLLGIALLIVITVAVGLPQTADRDVDCVITSVGETITVAVDAPNPACDAATDRTINDCDHHVLDIPRESWPAAWGEPDVWSLLKGRYINGKLRAVSACSGREMADRRMLTNTRGMYTRNPLNLNGRDSQSGDSSPTPCNRRVSGFLEKILSE